MLTSKKGSLDRDLDVKKKLATSNLPFQAFEAFIQVQKKIFFSNPVRAFLENPLFVLWQTLIVVWRTLGQVLLLAKTFHIQKWQPSPNLFQALAHSL